MPSAPCQVGRQQPTIRRRLGDLQYFGWRWPQVVGLPAHEAERRIKQDCPGVYCEVVSVNALLTMCYCLTEHIAFGSWWIDTARL